MSNNIVLFNGAGPTAENGDSCPVRAIGHNDGDYFYVTPSGALRKLNAGHHTHNHLYSLFENKGAWLAENYPKKARGENAAGWDFKAVAERLMTDAANAGLVDLEKALRGVGVWRISSNEIIVHAGDAIMKGGEWIPAGQKIDGKFYIALPPTDRPAEIPASSAAAVRLYNFIKDSWAWEDREASARFLLGWIYCGIMAGALDWRPHIWATAPPGAGKSRLDTLVESLLGSSSDKVSDPTGAAVRGLLGVSARGVLADEVEPGDNNRAASMIELARMASTDSQGSVVRGTADGRVQRWPIRACFLFSSILVPTFRPQDYGRITVIEMKPLPEMMPAQIADFEAALLDTVAAGPEIRRRAIDGYHRFLQNKATYSAIMATGGHGRRAADQLASLLAGADTLLDDAATMPEAAKKIMEMLSVTDLTGGDEIGDDKECLQHLLSTRVTVQFNEGRQNFTIGELVEAAPISRSDWRQKELRKMGIAVSETRYPDGTGFELLQVSTTHREISRIYRDTRWRDGGHVRVLKRLPFALRDTDLVSFAGFKSRAVALLVADMPIDRKAAEDPPDLPA